MKRLYSETYGMILPDALEVEDKIQTFIHNLVKEFPDYNLNELELIIQRAVACELSVLRLTHSLRQRKIK